MRLTKQDYLRVLLPTKKEIFIIIALVLVVFFTFEFNLIYLKIFRNSIFSDTSLQQNFQSQIDAVFADNKIANTISLVVFWSGIGLVAYSIIWSIYSFFSEAKNEAEVVGEYVNQETKHEKLQRALVQAGLLAGLIALCLLSLNVTIPYIVSAWTYAIIALSYNIPSSIAQILGGLVGLSINFYLFKMIIDWIELLD
jgi:hypothetical protein